MNIVKVTNITPKRYYDWMFTTPAMLITLVAYLIYREKQNKGEDTSQMRVWDIFSSEKSNLIIICILNAIMLGLGYLGEIKKMHMGTSVATGFVAFCAYFYLIFINYVGSDTTSQVLFYVYGSLVFIWY